jgi:hypothetical protein
MMFRSLFFVAIFSFALMGESCHSACKKMAKTNGKLIAGKESFGMKKNSKYKRKNRKGA